MTNRHPVIRIGIAWATSMLLIVMMDPSTAYATHSSGPVNLGTAANFAVLANTAITNTGATVVTGGHVGSGPTAPSTVGGFTGPPSGSVTPPGIIYGPTDTEPDTANTALNAAFTEIDLRPFDDSSLTGENQLGITPALAPGIYELTDATFQLAVNENLTLDAGGVSSAIWIFQVPTVLNIAANTEIVLAGLAQACNVYWQVGVDVSIGADAIFMGHILAGRSITLGNNVTVNGSLLAGADDTTGAITLDDDTITKTACSTPAPAPSANLTLIKIIINDNGGTKVNVSDFPLFIDGTMSTTGVPHTLAPGTHTVTEPSTPGYLASVWGGACSPSGIVTLVAGDNKTCTITNNDIASGASNIVVPPLISIVKLPTPLSLPAGAGLVTYSYTVKNVGTVAMNSVTVVDNKCAQVTFTSGDTNTDSELDLSETWLYRCATSIAVTTTNSATAVGYANGISATDIAFATVVVGTAASPPLIHVIKTPNRFVVPFGGGSVTYTYKVTNPGFVALRNVTLVDDRCTNISDHTGDTDRDNLLDRTETWVFTCEMNIRRNTVNTVTATGRANGLTATDFALATVVVAPAGVAPGFPNTGIGPDHEKSPWNVIAPLGIVVGAFLLLGVRRRHIR